MGEISEMMTSGILCCNCGVALDEKISELELGIPVRCDSCHGKDKNSSIGGIFSESYVLSAIKKDRLLEILIAYNLELRFHGKNNIQINSTELREFIGDMIIAFAGSDSEEDE